MTPKKISFDLELSNKIFKNNLLSLIEVSQDSIKDQKKKYEQFLQSLTLKEQDRDYLDKGSHYANIDWILLNSILLSAYSFFEHHISALSRIVEDQIATKIKIDNLSGTGITKFCNYLFLIGNIQSANRINKEWQEIIQFQKVRNLITHNGGIMLNDASKNIKDHECFKFLKSYNVTMAGTLGYIRITKIDFVKRFAEITALISDNLTVDIFKLLNNNSNGSNL